MSRVEWGRVFSDVQTLCLKDSLTSLSSAALNQCLVFITGQASVPCIAVIFKDKSYTSLKPHPLELTFHNIKLISNDTHTCGPVPTTTLKQIFKTYITQIHISPVYVEGFEYAPRGWTTLYPSLQTEFLPDKKYNMQ